MRKIALALVLAIGLGGCAQLTAIESGLSLATKSITNPVTKDELYKLESAVQVGFIALNTYKRSCAQGLVDKSCRANVAAIQQYTRQIPPYLAQLRSFVRANDQVNASVVYNQLVTLYGNAKNTATAFGVKFGS